MWNDITTTVANRILDRIDQGPTQGRRYSPAPQAKDRAAWQVVADECHKLNEFQAKGVIAKWIKNGVLVVRDYFDPKERRECKGLLVGTRPGGSWED
jgi:hypothetical protein